MSAMFLPLFFGLRSSDPRGLLYVKGRCFTGLMKTAIRIPGPFCQLFVPSASPTEARFAM